MHCLLKSIYPYFHIGLPISQTISHCNGQPLLDSRFKIQEITPNALSESVYLVVWLYISPIFFTTPAVYHALYFHCAFLYRALYFDVTWQANLQYFTKILREWIVGCRHPDIPSMPTPYPNLNYSLPFHNTSLNVRHRPHPSPYANPKPLLSPINNNWFWTSSLKPPRGATPVWNAQVFVLGVLKCTHYEWRLWYRKKKKNYNEGILCTLHIQYYGVILSS